MARGLAKEQSQKKGLAKQAARSGGSKDDGLTPAQRNERDAKLMAEKAARKAAEKAKLAETSEGKAKLEQEAARKAKLAAARKERGSNPQATSQNGMKVKHLTEAQKAANAKAARDRGIADAKKEGRGAAGGGAKTEGQVLKELEGKLMPMVKQGDALVAEGDPVAGLALYQQAMDGFRGAGFKRPKLKEKMDAAKATIAAQEEEAEC